MIEDIQTIVQGMQTEGYDLEGLAKSNAVLTSSNFAVMSQLAQMNVTVNAMQAQLKTLASAQTNQARPKKVLLLDLWEKFHSREKNLLSKEIGTSRGSILQ